MQFNIKDYPGKYLMHCKTEEEAQSFCDYLNSIGRRTIVGAKYDADRVWPYYYNRLTFNFNEGTYCTSNWYKDHCKDYTILEWEDFMNKTFTKSDLKTGDVVQFKNGMVGILIKERNVIIMKNGWLDFHGYANDLTRTDDCCTITAVRRPRENNECNFNAFQYKLGVLVYERQEVEEMTLAEVCKLLGKNIKIVKE